jgi:hypothetical protein
MRSMLGSMLGSMPGRCQSKWQCLIGADTGIYALDDR